MMMHCDSGRMYRGGAVVDVAAQVAQPVRVRSTLVVFRRCSAEPITVRRSSRGVAEGGPWRRFILLPVGRNNVQTPSTSKIR